MRDRKTAGNTLIRQIEIAGFRAWPAASVHEVGSWLVRLTPAYPSKRLNSVNPLDPEDDSAFAERIGQATALFRAAGVGPCFRLSPLAPEGLAAHLAATGWQWMEDVLVMAAPLADIELSAAPALAPCTQSELYADASLAIHGRGDDLRQSLIAILDHIIPGKAMLVLEESGEAVASALCVADDGLAGLFDVAVLERARRKGHGRTIIRAALAWALRQGAQTAWLQVESRNEIAIALYRSLGFQPAYHYAYLGLSQS